ncbi:MAG: hypothetical protein FJZ60_00875 [Chlamydiae bacterium]|nr:hypothetical protein [Chlamydiota bacterium]
MSALGNASNDFGYQPSRFTAEERHFTYNNQDQGKYLRVANQAIRHASDRIQTFKKGQSASDTPITLFRSLILQMSQDRQRHAKDVQTPLWWLFGKRREQVFCPTRCVQLWLYAKYRWGGDRLKQALIPILEKAKWSVSEDFAMEQEEVFDGRKTVLKIEILGKKTILGRKLMQPPADNPFIYPDLELLDHLPANYISAVEKAFEADPEQFKRIESKYPYIAAEKSLFSKTQLAGEILRRTARVRALNLWKQFRDAPQESLPQGDRFDDQNFKMALNQIFQFQEELEEYARQKKEPLPKPIDKNTKFMRVKVAHQIGERLVPMVEFFTSIQPDKKSLEKTIDSFKNKSTILMVQQDVTYIEDTLEECERLFNQMVQFKPEDGVSNLKKWMAEFIYLASYSHRDARGTAAENEWIERAVFDALGFRIERPNDQMPDLTALTTWELSKFVSYYASVTNVVQK